MKKIKMLMMAALTIFSLTLFAQKAGKKDNTKHLTIYTCPMHDSIKAKLPGNCPICGMKLQLTAKEQMKKDVTKHYACPTHLTEVSDKPGKFPKCGTSLTLSPKEKMKVQVMNNYTCPMHGDVKSDKPGICPNCGMKLIKHKG
ncbi:hypothetical protein LK994_14440 [Ferruginibacter lapsinanis]|uniref:heavy metal-binding domain-containing protein n=1 Tax=Ferruginibacter lapsinanis TaxID=563172 RepID=UPI001E64B579|nr:heavy metal-binding domain-containing protein [Ferruginibacter lapsinanis]UEG49836.1 hypothetical protein LK994_14440 [Ferruginibacter lapsinanis]